MRLSHWWLTLRSLSIRLCSREARNVILRLLVRVDCLLLIRVLHLRLLELSLMLYKSRLRLHLLLIRVLDRSLWRLVSLRHWLNNRLFVPLTTIVWRSEEPITLLMLLPGLVNTGSETNCAH